ncbi:hypothetical protein D3OALGB2SA_5631 [Olavius algarvensis associated proteobacterium Delta 3]|nr:hypothetical protein D3OALGB2SA_5631 [Olavius algarvensis associated proteobacterium Delta 3]
MPETPEVPKLTKMKGVGLLEDAIFHLGKMGSGLALSHF